MCSKSTVKSTSFNTRRSPNPKVGPNEVLFKIRAAGCNYNDIWARRGLPGMEIIMPHVSGSDASGEVVEVGARCGV